MSDKDTINVRMTKQQMADLHEAMSVAEPHATGRDPEEQERLSRSWNAMREATGEYLQVKK